MYQEKSLYPVAVRNAQSMTGTGSLPCQREERGGFSLNPAVDTLIPRSRMIDNPVIWNPLVDIFLETRTSFSHAAKCHFLGLAAQKLDFVPCFQT